MNDLKNTRRIIPSLYYKPVKNYIPCLLGLGEREACYRRCES